MPPKCEQSKRCECCGSLFFKRYRDSQDQWAGRQFCSAHCSNASKKRTPVSERFWRFAIKKHRGCWGWDGAKDNRGYGSIGAGGRADGHAKAHRVSWEIHFGPIPEGLSVLHLCDNPSCCNPDHLAVGSHRANMFDAGRKKRFHPNSIANLKAGANK